MEAVKKNNQLIDTRTEVSRQEKTFLVHGTRKVPICAEYASKYSLFFRYLENHPLNDPDEPVNLLIRNSGQSIEIGPCRILTGPELNGYEGRLVFLRDVYDIRSLLTNNTIVKLQSPFSDLPQVMARKDKIRQPFKDYVANLVYDLRVYKQVFDKLDSETIAEPEEVRMAVTEAIIRTEGPAFRRFFQDTIDELINLTDDFTPKEHQQHGFYFRNHLWEFILSCPFAARANLKPRRYAGDSGQMRMIYLNDYQGDSTFSKLLHKHAVAHTASQSVRNRIALIPRLINDFRNDSQIPDSDKIDLLSVGSGAAFELNDIIKSPQDCSKYNFILFDQDPVALEEAADLAGEIEKKIGAIPKINYIEGSVRTMLFSRKIMEPWGKFDFIYSMGLFDYLNSRVAAAVLNRLYQLIKPGGELVVGNFNVSNPSRYYMEYWGDWVLIHRTEEEFRSLFPDTSSATVRVIYDETGAQMFLNIKRRKTAHKKV
jgi:extracellular factor (EF) 3-hydroxypalmitic acid methyl ester biosynthesis protein